MAGDSVTSTPHATTAPAHDAHLARPVSHSGLLAFELLDEVSKHNLQALHFSGFQRQIAQLFRLHWLAFFALGGGAGRLRMR